MLFRIGNWIEIIHFRIYKIQSQSHLRVIILKSYRNILIILKRKVLAVVNKVFLENISHLSRRNNMENVSDG